MMFSTVRKCKRNDCPNGNPKGEIEVHIDNYVRLNKKMEIDQGKVILAGFYHLDCFNEM